MAASIQTKLHPPQLSPNHVERPALLQKLMQGLQQQRKLTIVTAPAGFGKTTLVTRWLQTVDRPFAWLSLSAADNAPDRFLSYFLDALQTIFPEFGEATRQLLNSPALPTVDYVLSAIINEFAPDCPPFALVLDDVHLLSNKYIVEALTFWSNYMPDACHLVLISREAPLLPLHLMRARGQVTELDVRDCRFSRAESAEFIQSHLSLTLEKTDPFLEKLDGWAAGLQMATIALESTTRVGKRDLPTALSAFRSDHRFIRDYFAAEVLDNLPDTMRRFLVQISILERFSPSLCDCGHAAPQIATNCCANCLPAVCFCYRSMNRRRGFVHTIFFLSSYSSDLTQLKNRRYMPEPPLGLPTTTCTTQRLTM